MKIGSLVYFYTPDGNRLINTGIIIKRNKYSDFVVWWTESGWSENSENALKNYCEIYEP